MTIVISSARVTSLAAASTSNNPIIAWNNLGASGTWSTGAGTEVNSAAFAGTGTTYDQWSATLNGSGDASIVVDLGSAQTVSFIAIAAHNGGDLAAQAYVGHSPTGLGGSWVSPAASSYPTDNQAIGWYFADTSDRYWRVVFDTATTGDAVIGTVFVGTVLTAAQRIYQSYKPAITPTEVALQSNVSEGGHLLGSSTVKKASTASADLQHIPAATIRGADWKAFQAHYNGGGGFFWGWRPTDLPDLHYAWRSGGALSPKSMGVKTYMSAELNMRFYDDP